MKTDMQQDELKTLVDSLDSKVPREGAQVRLRQYGGGPDESQFIANRSGYLRFGIELLKAAFAPVGERKNQDAIPVDLAYLITSDSNVGFDWFERREDLGPSSERESVGSWVLKITMILVFASVIGLALVGFVTVIQFMVKHLLA